MPITAHSQDLVLVVALVPAGLPLSEWQAIGNHCPWCNHTSGGHTGAAPAGARGDWWRHIQGKTETELCDKENPTLMRLTSLLRESHVNIVMERNMYSIVTWSPELAAMLSTLGICVHKVAGLTFRNIDCSMDRYRVSGGLHYLQLFTIYNNTYTTTSHLILHTMSQLYITKICKNWSNV